MRKIKLFLKKHQDWVLSFLSIVMSSIIIVFFIWGISVIARGLGNAVGPAPESEADEGFNLEEAKELDLRGLDN